MLPCSVIGQTNKNLTWKEREIISPHLTHVLHAKFCRSLQIVFFCVFPVVCSLIKRAWVKVTSIYGDRSRVKMGEESDVCCYLAKSGIHMSAQHVIFILFYFFEAGKICSKTAFLIEKDKFPKWKAVSVSQCRRQIASEKEHVCNSYPKITCILGYLEQRCDQNEHNSWPEISVAFSEQPNKSRFFLQIRWFATGNIWDFIGVLPTLCSILHLLIAEKHMWCV